MEVVSLENMNVPYTQLFGGYELFFCLEVVILEVMNVAVHG